MVKSSMPPKNKSLRISNGKLTGASLPITILYGEVGAAILQHVHYQCCHRQNIKEGHRWFYCSIGKWAEEDGLSCFSRTAISEAISILRASGVLIVGRYNKHSYDRTLWYRVNYEQLIAQVAQVNVPSFCLSRRNVNLPKSQSLKRVPYPNPTRHHTQIRHDNTR